MSDSTNQPSNLSESGSSSRQGTHRHDDLLQSMIGSFKRYQFWLFILILLTKFPVASHNLAILFLAPVTTFTCNSDGNAKCPCSEPEYDKKVFKKTIVTEWNLICDRRWLIGTTQLLFQFGLLVGSILFGMASDRYGRRRPMIAACVLEVVTGILAAFMPEYWSFTIVRMLLGAVVGGTMVIGFVIVMEFVGVKYRELLSALYQLPFNVGHMMLPGLAYIFRDYDEFQLSLSIPTIYLLSFICLLPESPRWYIAAKEIEEAIKVLERVAKFNKMPTEHIRSEILSHQASLSVYPKKGTIVDLFRTSNIRKNMIIMSILWLTCGFTFFGVSQFVGTLSGNIFLNVEINACVTLMGCLLSVPLMKVMGRRTIVKWLNIICGVCMLVLTVCRESWLAVALATVGTVCSFIVFVVVYLYAFELFPTGIRNVAIGLSSMMARVGSMLAPFVVHFHDFNVWLTPVLFGLLPMISGFLSILLPETKGREIATTVEQAEEFGFQNKQDDSVSAKT